MQNDATRPSAKISHAAMPENWLTRLYGHMSTETVCHQMEIWAGILQHSCVRLLLGDTTGWAGGNIRQPAGSSLNKGYQIRLIGNKLNARHIIGCWHGTSRHYYAIAYDLERGNWYLGTDDAFIIDRNEILLGTDCWATGVVSLGLRSTYNGAGTCNWSFRGH